MPWENVYSSQMTNSILIPELLWLVLPLIPSCQQGTWLRRWRYETQRTWRKSWNYFFFFFKSSIRPQSEVYESDEGKVPIFLLTKGERIMKVKVPSPYFPFFFDSLESTWSGQRKTASVEKEPNISFECPNSLEFSDLYNYNGALKRTPSLSSTNTDYPKNSPIYT